MRIRLENVSSKPNVWTVSDACLQGKDFMTSLQECRRIFSSSLKAYTMLASDARCRRVERLGEAVGLQILTTSVLAHLECEEEKSKHRMAGDESLEVIREILEGKCSAGLLKSECRKLFSFFDKVPSKCLESCFHRAFTQSLSSLSFQISYPVKV